MASRMYTSAKKLLMDGDLDLLAHEIRVVLIDTADYTFSAAHDFLDDVASGARVGTPQALGSKTTTGGVFDAANATFTAVTGDSCEAILVYRHVTNDADSPVVAYIDGITVTPNGGDITIDWNASGIFALTDV